MPGRIFRFPGEKCRKTENNLAKHILPWYNFDKNLIRRLHMANRTFAAQVYYGYYYFALMKK
jgi:hypothetical protein